jgi:vitamin B12/bleomycin/antimicrobial peptide transport system ATP-binding/permease protein
MLWVAVIYAIAATWIVNRVGRPLVGLNFSQQRYEADFRFSLIRFRENVEAVALYGGEARERDTFRGRFTYLVANWWAIMRRQKRLTWWTAGYSQAAVVFPYIVMAPNYFAQHIELGIMSQTVDAFAQVQQALSFIVNAYIDIAQWRSVVERLVTFHHAMHAAIDANAAKQIEIVPAATAVLEVDDLHVDLPDGKPLIDRGVLQVKAGEAVLIAGPSGSGKSTLFRAIAGIWPFGKGRVRTPAGAKVMFLPQKPYMPLGTLGECLSYPEPAAATTDADKRHALIDCGLEHFVARLTEEQNWGQVLSLGEQQRVAFARILLKKPDWVFLDEATASVDEPLERALYARLKERLPALTIVSISHRDGLSDYHPRRVKLEPGPAGAHLEPSIAATPAI